MTVTSPVLIQLVLSFIVATLRFTVEPGGDSGVVFSLISPNRNISFKLKDGVLFADSTSINRNPVEGEFRFSVRCLNDFALKLEVNDDSKVIPSPSLCKKESKNELLIGPDDGEPFHGCIKNGTLGSRNVLTSWCRSKIESSEQNSNENPPQILFSDASELHRPLQPLYIGEEVKSIENGSVALQWKNFYLFPEHRRFGISNSDVIFEVIDPPEHGFLKHNSASGKTTKSFTYEDLVGKKIFYVNNGDEDSEDNFDLQLHIRNSKVDFGDLKKKTYTIKVKVEQRNDPPQIIPGVKGALVHVAPGVKSPLTEDHIKIWDSDSQTNQVFIRVKNAVGGAKFTTRNGETSLTKFSLADFLNKKIFVSMDSKAQKPTASAEVDTIDSSGLSSLNTVTVTITNNPVEIHMVKNTGAKLSHKSSTFISSKNLSFVVNNFGDYSIPVTYIVVDQPEFGILECSKIGEIGEFQICSKFSQQEIEEEKIRYKHISENRPKTDFFTFKVLAGDSETPPHDFKIEFIPTSVRVYIQESLFLNNSEKAVIKRNNLLATTFPSHFQKNDLVYHIVEPPKYGILYRKLEGNRNRRIGVSSNFTQEHIDSESISYKLNFVQYTIVNDFFTFRLVTPAVTSELLKFEIIFIPSGNSIQLLNRTLVVSEGNSQAISNNTLWLETADDTTFDFRISIPPFSGDFVLTNPSGAKFILGSGDKFDSFDILEKRIFYEHSGDEAKNDRAFLIAESRYRQNTRIPLWFTVSIISEDDHPPRLEDFGNQSGIEHNIFVLENGERSLSKSLFPWTDKDSPGALLTFQFSESSFKDFVFFTKDSPPVPVRTFTTKDLERKRLVVRHLSLKKNSEMKYTVTDGKHKSSATLNLIAKEAFVELQKSKLKISEINFGGLFPISRGNISAETNLDFDLDDIREDSGLNLKFVIVEQPKFGTLSLDTITVSGKLKSSLPSSSSVWGFKIEDLRESRLQYIPEDRHENREKEDFFSFKIQTNKMNLGPFRILLKKENKLNPKMSTISSIKIRQFSNVTLDPRNFRISNFFGRPDSVEFRIKKPPVLGKISTIQNPRESIEKFSWSQLIKKEIFYFSILRGNSDEFELVACFSGSCSSPEKVKIIFEKDNIDPPEISRNEALVLVNANSGKISDSLLDIQDPDSSPETLKFLIWQPLGGYVADVKNPSTPLNSFSLADLQEGKISFISTSNSSGGFSFLVTDGLHQTRPEWFTVEKSTKISLNLEANSRLLAAPLQHAVIGMDLLRAKIPDIPESQIRYTIARAPIHGKIMLNKVKVIQKFTQADIDSRRISYFSEISDLGSWILKDYFNFVVSVDGNAKIKEEFRFRISLTFGALNSENLFNFVNLKSPLKMTSGSSLALNSSIIDLNELERFSGKEKLIVEVYRKPKKAEIIFTEEKNQDQASNSKEEPNLNELTSEKICSGRHLLIRAVSPGDDEIIFHIYPGGENEKKKSNRLRIGLHMEILPQDRTGTKIKQFREDLNIVSGGSTILEPADFQAEDEDLPPSEIIYKLVQRGSNGVRVVILDSFVTDEITFTQAQVNKGQVRLEHTPMSSEDRFDVLVFGIGQKSRALVVKIEPLALNLFNHSLITYEQGKTYVVLTKAHLGADSNGDRSKIIYNVTKTPENGTFYWVAGEKEADWFTQKNIDEGDILYAQLNMDAYQDSFEFTLGNEEMEMLQKVSNIKVLPKIDVQDLVTDAKQFTQINIGYLNATNLEGSTPRYLVVTPPNFGRIFLHPFPNESVVFFTQTEVNDGKLFFQAFDVDERTDDEVELELRGDGIQPARFKWNVDIRPVDKKIGVVDPGSRLGTNEITEDSNKATPNISPELNHHFPVIILLLIVLATVIILCCRRKSSKMQKSKAVTATRDEQGFHLNLSSISERELPQVSEVRGSELLDSTVYASVGRQRRTSTLKDITEEPSEMSSRNFFQSPLESPEKAPSPPQVKVTPLRQPLGSIGSAFKPTPLAALSKMSRSGPITGLPPSSVLSSSIKQSRASLDNAQPRTAKLKQDQYWV
ncbi:hypothetical protein FO519_004710 [Halicephalobus sp. NKZ332]|nr:hypothetical protein FO519_004710 [Halicephalobus sp. NKZ332]